MHSAAANPNGVRQLDAAWTSACQYPTRRKHIYIQSCWPLQFRHLCACLPQDMCCQSPPSSPCPGFSPLHAASSDLHRRPLLRPLTECSMRLHRLGGGSCFRRLPFVHHSTLCPPHQLPALPFFSARPFSVLLTLAAKRSDESDSWWCLALGLTLTNMSVFAEPDSAFCSTCVSLELRKGT